jgi:hypothetical protein
VTPRAIGRQETAILGPGVTQELTALVASATLRVHEAWAARTTDERATLLSDVCADDVDYVNPLRTSIGVPALAALIGELVATYPGYLPTRTSGLDIHHDAARYTWAMRDRAGNSVLAGIEIVRFTPAGRLTSILSFFGQPPTIRYTYRP